MEIDFLEPGTGVEAGTERAILRDVNMPSGNVTILLKILLRFIYNRMHDLWLIGVS